MILDAKMLPLELRGSDRAVVWNYGNRNGSKLTKLPYSPLSPQSLAAVDDPATWGSLEQAIELVESGAVDGVGIVLGDGLVGVDFDNCIDPVTGEIDPEVYDLIVELDSYTEVSPSGNGLHVLVRGALPPGRRRNGKLEIYDRDRYVTLTGEHLDGAPTTIEERTAQLSQIHAARLGGSSTSTRSNAPTRASAASQSAPDTSGVSDAALIDRMCSARNGELFSTLWEGDWSSYESQSNADQALCNILAFWTGGDNDRIDELFRQSGLMRDKWDERRGSQTYGGMTIARATADMIALEMEEEAPEPRRRFRLVSDVELNTLPDPSWQIEGVFPQDAFVVLYGPTNHGKSFIALDMAMCLGAGLPWKGHKITGANKVVYIYSEGTNSAKLRAAAWKLHHGYEPNDFCNVWFLPSSVDFTDATGTDIQEFLAEIERTVGGGVGLVVIDTLARNFGAANENSTQDMNTFVRHCDQIRTALGGATVLVVHHTGHDASRERGSVALKGAANTHLRAHRPDERQRRINFSCEKQKDGGEPFEAVPLALTVVPLGEDRNGVPVSSCVVECMSPERVAAEEELAPSARQQLEVLRDSSEGLAYSEWLSVSKIGKTTFKNNRTQLEKLGLVGKDSSTYLLTPQGRARLENLKGGSVREETDV